MLRVKSLLATAVASVALALLAPAASAVAFDGPGSAAETVRTTAVVTQEDTGAATDKDSMGWQ
ncbi:hypothetical protein [Streptomyces sp. NRRL S-87]|uniref:hypothetical protein n=1 Tax=Streptomyces sp. NRRL S-87 TaxID=1463920 RepID=UPI0004BFC3B0|nr:hypothetical protein [Streptomyces sp. NRRL S-87]